MKCPYSGDKPVGCMLNSCSRLCPYYPKSKGGYMKRVLMLAVFMVVGSLASAIETAFLLPNAEGAFFYDNKSGTVITGISSKFLSVGDFDVRAGFAGGKMIGALSYDIRKLENLGLNVKYLWSDTNLTFGFWAGYDFEKSTGGYGETLIVLQIGLK